MSSLMVYDVETTGFSSTKNALIEVSFTPIINGDIQPPRTFRMRPHEGAIIEDSALKVNGYIREDIMTWGDPKEVLKEIILYLDSFERKFKQVGHNVAFDKRFLSAFFSRYGCYGDFYSIFRSNSFDTEKMAREQDIKAASFKLGDLCKYFEIPYENGHKAENDSVATAHLYQKLEASRPMPVNRTLPGSYQQKRRDFLDSKYIIFNPEGDIFLNKEAFKNKEAMRFIIGELWDLYCEED